MEKSSRSSLDDRINGPGPNKLLPVTKSETSTIASIRRSSHESQQDEPESQDEPKSEDDVSWSRLTFVVIALVLSMFMVCETSVHCFGCGLTFSLGVAGSSKCSIPFNSL